MLECADASHGLNGHVMSDGGCTNPGDVAKAFGAGADFVMIGGARIFFFHRVALNTYIYAEKASRVLSSKLHVHLVLILFIGLFAGHDQCGGDTVVKDGQKYKLFYGMSSDTAMEKHEGSIADYRASEGKTITVPCRQACTSGEIVS